MHLIHFDFSSSASLSSPEGCGAHFPAYIYGHYPQCETFVIISRTSCSSQVLCIVTPRNISNMNFLCAFVLFAFLMPSALSCSCFAPPFEDRYCASEISVRGTVVARFDNCPGTCDPIQDQFDGAITYIVKVITTFRGTPPEDNVMFLQTAVNGALCGINLSIGRQYLFDLGRMQSGSRCPGQFWNVGLCDFPTLWTSVTPEQRSFLTTNANTGQSLCI